VGEIAASLSLPCFGTPCVVVVTTIAPFPFGRTCCPCALGGRRLFTIERRFFFFLFIWCPKETPVIASTSGRAQSLHKSAHAALCGAVLFLCGHPLVLSLSLYLCTLPLFFPSLCGDGGDNDIVGRTSFFRLRRRKATASRQKRRKAQIRNSPFVFPKRPVGREPPERRFGFVGCDASRTVTPGPPHAWSRPR
jgi:hypothetical protein